MTRVRLLLLIPVVLLAVGAVGLADQEAPIEQTEQRQGLRDLGRRGHGPGEFESVHQIMVGPQDSLHVFDLRTGKWTQITTDGKDYKEPDWVPVLASTP
jgi:hypothetical protein